MAHMCHGKFFVQFGASFGTSLLPIGASRKDPRGSDRECVPLIGETTIAASSRLVFFSTGNMEQQEIHSEI